MLPYARHTLHVFTGREVRPRNAGVILDTRGHPWTLVIEIGRRYC